MDSHWPTHQSMIHGQESYCLSLFSCCKTKYKTDLGWRWPEFCNFIYIYTFLNSFNMAAHNYSLKYFHCWPSLICTWVRTRLIPWSVYPRPDSAKKNQKKKKQNKKKKWALFGTLQCVLNTPESTGKCLQICEVETLDSGRSSGSGWTETVDGQTFFQSCLSVPAAESHPHSMMLTPPSFIEGMVLGRCCLQTWCLEESLKV